MPCKRLSVVQLWSACSVSLVLAQPAHHSPAFPSHLVPRHVHAIVLQAGRRLPRPHAQPVLQRGKGVAAVGVEGHGSDTRRLYRCLLNQVHVLQVPHLHAKCGCMQRRRWRFQVLGDGSKPLHMPRIFQNVTVMDVRAYWKRVGDQRTLSVLSAEQVPRRYSTGWK